MPVFKIEVVYVVKTDDEVAALEQVMPRNRDDERIPDLAAPYKVSTTIERLPDSEPEQQKQPADWLIPKRYNGDHFELEGDD